MTEVIYNEVSACALKKVVVKDDNPATCRAYYSYLATLLKKTHLLSLNTASTSINTITN